AAEACNSFRVVIGVLVASLTSLFLARTLNLWGRPALGRFTHVPYSFHFLMMDLTEFLGMFSALDIFFYPSPDLYFSITFFSELLGVIFSLPGVTVARNTDY